MKKHHNKILTLINIEEPIKTIVESTFNLANTMKAEVTFLYVKKPADTTNKSNQLELIRTMADQQKAIEKLRNMLFRAQNTTSSPITYNIVEGNIKNEIKQKISAYDPDLIVVGKRKPSRYRLIGNQVTELVLKNFQGPLLIAHPSKVLEIKENLSLGVLNDLSKVEDNTVTSTLLEHSKQPLKLFKIGDGATSSASLASQTKTINYTFENNANALYSLSNYVQKNNVHLLCVERTDKAKTSKNLKMKEVLKRINTSMLMLGNTGTNNLINI